MNALDREYDYVIVGGGAAGCVLAARLSEQPDVTVALLEAGAPDRGLLLGVPGANIVTGVHPAYNWSYQSDPVDGLDGRSLYWAQGRVLGGSGSINGMMYARGHRRDYDGWRAQGCIGWGYEDVLPYFRKAETNERGASALHGGDGPLQVSKGRATAPICDLFLAGAAEAGHPIVEDLSDDEPEAFGHMDLTIGRGRRSSTAAAYLRPAAARKNLTILCRSQATRIVIEKGRARGVEYANAGARSTIRAAREVILAGGSVNSPQLLMLSGVGPAAHLKDMGVTPLVDRAEVGRNLQNHPMYRLMYTCPEPVTAYAYVRPWGALRTGLQYLLARSGPLSRGLFPTAGFVYGETGNPDSEAQVCLAPALVIRRGPGVFGVLPREHGFTLLVSPGTPLSRGEVRLKSADPMAHAAILPNYFSHPKDIDFLAGAAERTRGIMRTRAMKPYVSAEIQPRGPIRSLDDLKRDIRATTVTNYHAAGTCRMGADEGSVLDLELRVRGVEGLRVADASVMPTIASNNTYAPTIMIAEKAADIIKRAA